jgi:uncharacterized membrane protein
MDEFLDNIEKYKFAIFGTLLLHVIAFLIFAFSTVKDVSVVPTIEVPLSIPLDDIDFEPEMKEILELNKDNTPSENVSNLISDANDTRDKSYEDYSTNAEEFSEESMKTAKELEAEYFKDAAAKNERTDVADNMEKHELNKETGTEDNVKKGGNNAFAGDVMISFNLKDRKSAFLPNPGYTCNGAGTVVIQIKVDKAGSVKTSSYLEGQSSRASSCMIEMAMKYAKKSRFDYGSGLSLQTGTITYKFLGK